MYGRKNITLMKLTYLLKLKNFHWPSNEATKETRQKKTLFTFVFLFFSYKFSYRSADNRLRIIEKFTLLCVVIVSRTINISRKLFSVAIYDANLRFMTVIYFVLAMEWVQVRKENRMFSLLEWFPILMAYF